MDSFEILDINDTENQKNNNNLIVDESDNYLNHNVNLKNNDEIELIEDDKPSNIDELISKIEESSRKLEQSNSNDSEELDLDENLDDEVEMIEEEVVDDDEIETMDIEPQKEVEFSISDDVNTKLNNSSLVNDFSLLEQYGENFSTKEYLTNPAIGRDKEIGELIVTLLTPEKSGILVGKPGIGKTAIVEGLGYRIKNDDVPDALKGYTIFKLNTASLTGVDPVTHELKIQKIVDNLRNLNKVMVFIDEIHTLIGNGENTLDFANIFKPVIDRGTVKLIGATTSDEYDRYILRDKAFVRRFQKIEVSEPTREMVIEIMMGTYPKFEKKMGLTLKYSDFIKEKIMAFITDATSEFKRVYETSVRYPDIALTILQSAFSYASFDNRSEVNIRDIRKAIKTTKLIYPDVIKKELVKFNKDFRDVYLMETKQILKGEL
ncbi:MAG: ATP-dependent Clp protease ATP-binding subunit [Bacilli bacterium]|nr:ATP-dependent Clp protease ATP-binding subunit [Bacilli bacterium]